MNGKSETIVAGHYRMPLTLLRLRRWKASGEQIDDRIIEVVWDANHQNWRKLRFRTDKTDGNFTTVVQSVITSIKDGVEAPVVSGYPHVCRTMS